MRSYTVLLTLIYIWAIDADLISHQTLTIDAFKPLTLANVHMSHTGKSLSSTAAITTPAFALPPAQVETTSILCSSFLAALLLYPVDVLRSLSMMSPGTPLPVLLKDFIGSYGLGGFLKQGIVPELTRATLMRGVKFTLYPMIHRHLYKKAPSEGTVKSKLIAASVTAVPEVALIMPLEVSKIILTLDKNNELKNSMPAAMAKAWRDYGPKSLFTGWAGVQYRQLSWGAAYFVTLKPYKRLTTRALSPMPEGEGKDMLNNLVSGFLAGVTGAVFNTPGDTVRSVVQKRLLSTTPTRATFLSVGKEIVREKGVASLWSGFGWKAVHLGGGGAVMALAVPKVKALLGGKKD